MIKFPCRYFEAVFPSMERSVVEGSLRIQVTVKLNRTFTIFSSCLFSAVLHIFVL